MASAAPADSATNDAGSSESCMYRLVIRAEIIPDEIPASAVRPRWNVPALALAVGGGALLLALGWFGISRFDAESPTPPTASEALRSSDAQSPSPAPAPREAAPASAPIEATKTTPVESGAPPQSALPASQIQEVIPDVPRSALQTIRGTVRVAVLVTFDRQGTVVAVTAEDPGPSRYFERLAIDAAKQWTFPPANANQPRRVLVRFNFTRAGVTARTSAL